jgi:hypothetical protein
MLNGSDRVIVTGVTNHPRRRSVGIRATVLPRYAAAGLPCNAWTTFSASSGGTEFPS